MIKKLPFILLAVLFCWVAFQLTHVPMPQAGAPAVLYANQTRDDLRLLYKNAIGSAEKSVQLLVYSLRDPTIIEALRRKGDEGTEVTVVCNGKGSRGLGKKLGPNVRLVRRHSKGLMHLKILTIDGERTWIGSANMTPTSLRMYPNLVVGLHSEELGQFMSDKGNNMSHIGQVELFPQQTFTVGGQDVELWFFPDNDGGPDRLIELIDTAQKSLRVALFTWTRTDLTEALIAAQERGISVEVVIDRTAARGAGKKVTKILDDAGIPVALSTGTHLLHHKMLCIDGTTLVNGSANWTKAAFTQNEDCFIIVHNLTKQQRTKMENLWWVIQAESEPYLP